MAEKSSSILAASFALGTFIALSPSIPFQTPLLFGLSWLFGLNAAVTFAAVYIVNNPLTMVPIYVIDYAVGVWVFQKVLGISLTCYNPAWVERFNTFISKYIDIKAYLGEGFCIWYLLLGGVLFALVVSVASYPFLKWGFDRLRAQIEKQRRTSP